MLDKLRKQIDKMIPRDKIATEIECAIDEQIVECSDLEDDGLDYEDSYYVGVPAPDYLQPDPWFGDPILSEKSQELREADVQRELTEASMKQQVTKEPDNIHEVMYNMGTDNGKTTVQLNPPGGSENFQGGPNGYGWMSGKRG